MIHLIVTLVRVDGLGDAGVPEVELKIEAEHASLALARLCSTYPDQVCMLHVLA